MWGNPYDLISIVRRGARRQKWKPRGKYDRLQQVLYRLHDRAHTHPLSGKGQENLLCSGDYYSDLPKVSRAYFYVLVRPRSHPAVLQRRGGRHDSRHHPPLPLWLYSPRHSVQAITGPGLKVRSLLPRRIGA